MFLTYLTLQRRSCRCFSVARKARTFGSHGLHVWLAWLAWLARLTRLARMARTFGSLARWLAHWPHSPNIITELSNWGNADFYSSYVIPLSETISNYYFVNWLLSSLNATFDPFVGTLTINDMP